MTVDGHVGYYAAGMNQQAEIIINGNAGTGVAENMMSGTVWVKGNASQSAGATAHGGLLVIEGNAAARCGISMKGVDIVVGGDVGHMSAFMAQAGRLVVRGDAGEALGDSIYEAASTSAATSRRSARTASPRRCAPEHHRRTRTAAEGGGLRRRRHRPRTPATARRAPVPLPRRQRGELLMNYASDDRARLGLRESATFDRATIAAIQRAAETGIYDIRGWGAKRPLPHFDDLLFLGASMSRYPLEGYRERCGTDVVLGDRHAKHPLHLDIPVTIAGMSFGALSGPAKEALGRGASEVGHVDHHRRRRHDPRGTRAEQEPGLPVSAVALRDEPRRPAQGRRDRDRARPGRQARRRRNAAGAEDLRAGRRRCARCPRASTSASACRHPDWTGPDDLTIKINELREITDWEKPIYVKVGATRTYYDVKLAVHAGADVVVVDGMQGGTAATQEVFIEHVGIPTLAAMPQAVQALQELGVHRKVQLIVSGGIRNGADVAKALALGADAVAIGTAALIALGDNHPRYAAEYEKLGSAAGFLRRLPGRPRPGGHHHAGPGAGGAVRPGRGRAPAGELPAGADAWRRRPSRAPAARRTCATSSPRTWSP